MAEHPAWSAELTAHTEEQMVALGRELAAGLRAGDLVILTGDLGAGKTTLTRGIGEGLGVRGRIASPTFIIARTHASDADGPPLVHVDAYRLTSVAEVDDLDLDTSMAEAVTVVEWGAGLVEDLSADRLEVTIVRQRGAGGQEQPREITVAGHGRRWGGNPLELTGSEHHLNGSAAGGTR